MIVFIIKFDDLFAILMEDFQNFNFIILNLFMFTPTIRLDPEERNMN